MLTVETYLNLNHAALMRLCRDYGVKGFILGAPLSNPKVAKNAKENGVFTWTLNLSPAKSSGRQVCAYASEGCEKACLDSAGNPVYLKTKQAARKARTNLFFENRPLFVACLIKEIKANERKGRKENYATAYRPNTTSDIPYEKYKVDYFGKLVSIADIMHINAPLAKLYDYTKYPDRVTNTDFYTLTFSLSENNDKAARACLRRGVNVAVVFDTKRGQPLPLKYTIDGEEFLLIDGDVTDYRPEDPTPRIVGLRAKGKAIGDTSGFVRPALQSTFMSA